MSRVHDMGGRFGDGALVPEPEEVKFHADWHPRALALTIASGALGQWNLDMSRRAREGLAPSDYARFSYYEKWLAGLSNLLVETGVVTRSELECGVPEGASALANKRLEASAVAEVLARGGPAKRDAGPAATFVPGDHVVTRRPAENVMVGGGHTRLPGYLAGATGVILRCHGNHVLPDSNAHGRGEAPEPLYAVAFRAGDLWAHPEHENDEVIADLWQSYLTKA